MILEMTDKEGITVGEEGMDSGMAIREVEGQGNVICIRMEWKLLMERYMNSGQGLLNRWQQDGTHSTIISS